MSPVLNEHLTRSRFPTVAAMGETLADRVSEVIRAAVAERGHATIVVSGGRFSKHFFRILRDRPLPWDAVRLVLADERWVEPSDELSNERLVRDELLEGAASAASLVGLKTEGDDAAAALAEVEVRIGSVDVPFDLVLLGMGDDGHTASLFPSAPAVELQQGLDPLAGERVAVLHPRVSPVPRITLTLPTLLNAREIMLHIPGASKLKTLELALEDGPVQAMPIRGILRQRKVPVDILTCETEEP